MATASGGRLNFTLGTFEMSAWQTITAAFLGNAIVLGILGWLAKSLVEKLIQRDSKRFELDITSKAAATMEQLKSELEIRAIEHQVRFSRLHEKRASVIADLNSLIVESLWEAESFLSPIRWNGEPDKPEKHQIAMNKLVELFRYFDRHRIFLPEALCSDVDQLISEVRSHVITFGVYMTFDDSTSSAEVRKERHEAWIGGWNAIKEQVPAVRSKLENAFRALLGSST